MNAKKAPFSGTFFKKSGGDLLSQGDSPKYHRRWRA